MTTFGDMVFQFGGVPVGALGVGNVYYVIKTNESHYNAFINSHQGQYPDGSWRVHGATAASSHTAIQAALDACVEGRNDYVIIQPSDSDYDITAAITLSKKSVHLICPAGLGLERGATNACRIHQNTAATAIFAVSDSSIEIAGFYLKPYADVSHITIAATSYTLNIHHNLFSLNWSSAPAAAILCAGDGGAWGQVSHHNFFMSTSGNAVTCASLITIGSGATGARCDYNDIYIGDNNILTSAITNGAIKGTNNYNNFMVAGNQGTITTCITQGSWAVAIGNRGTVGADALVTGGYDDVSAVDNMNSLAGGTIADDLD